MSRDMLHFLESLMLVKQPELPVYRSSEDDYLEIETRLTVKVLVCKKPVCEIYHAVLSSLEKYKILTDSEFKKINIFF